VGYESAGRGPAQSDLQILTRNQILVI
jgi:hypothetical protein